MIYTAYEEKTEDRRIRKTKKSLKIALVNLLLQKPVEEITVKELTDLADVHRGTFYNHYLDVFDLKKQMEQEINDEFKAIIEQHNYCKLGECPYEMFVSVLRYLKENREIIPLLLRNPGMVELKNNIYGILLERCLSSYLPIPFPGTPNLHIYEEHFCKSGVIGILTAWMENDMNSPPEELSNVLCSILKDSTASL